jgi:hypothetical protein
MNNSLDEVRRDIEDTRLAIGEKIGRLENKIETTATTTLNPAYHVRTRPWPTLGTFVVLGWFVGRALKPRTRAEQYPSMQPASASNDIIRSFVSGAASMMGVVAGDWVRDLGSRTKSAAVALN